MQEALTFAAVLIITFGIAAYNSPKMLEIIAAAMLARIDAMRVRKIAYAWYRQKFEAER